MTPRLKDGIQRYCLAVFFTFAATWLRLAMSSSLGERVPFGTYLLSVLLAAWLVGTGPAIASLLLGILAAAHYIVPPANSLKLNELADVWSLVIYGIVGAVAISLFHRSARQHDVTRRQLEKIESLSVELQAADCRKDEFLALLSHELRNPLAPIRSGVVLLERGDLGDARQRTILRTMSRQLEQLIRIVDDLLDVSRFAYGRIELDCRPVDLRELIDTAVEQAQHDIDERRHELQVVVPPRPVIVRGDGIRIVQIVTNLLTNAAKYTPKEGTIHVLLDAGPQVATLHVVDNGIGITEEIKPHIFELFARSREAIRRDQNGLGLGLPIARQFADMHQGRLDVSSEGPGRGSRFTLVLPLDDKQRVLSSAVAKQRPVPAKPVGPASGGPSKMLPQRVLIIDDNRDAAETMSTLLTLHDYQTCTAQDGPHALHCVEEFRPSIVLLDIGLPGMDGYEVAQRLRADEAHRDLLIIAVTGWGAQADIRKSKASGINHHLVKPVDPKQLFRLMERDPVVEVVHA